MNDFTMEEYKAWDGFELVVNGEPLKEDIKGGIIPKARIAVTFDYPHRPVRGSISTGSDVAAVLIQNRFLRVVTGNGVVAASARPSDETGYYTIMVLFESGVAVEICDPETGEFSYEKLEIANNEWVSRPIPATVMESMTREEREVYDRLS